MPCPRCHQVQPAKARFCGSCGLSLAAAVVQPKAHTLWGRPLHFWLLVASTIAVVALLLPWYSGGISSSVSWNETGYEYFDGTRSTWSLPSVSTSAYGGGNGLSLFTLALAGTIGGLAYRYRDGVWPRKAAIGLAVAVGLVCWVGFINLLSDANLGPLLFALAGCLAAVPSFHLLKSASR